MAKKFTSMSGSDLQQSLIGKLRPVADNIRDLATRVGLRPYQVFIIQTRWAGDYRGDGVDEVISTLELLPTPKVEDLGSLNERVGPVGVEEVGNVLITGISASYTEDELRGWTAEGIPPDANVSVFWEVNYPRETGTTSRRRRFHLAGAPVYMPGRLSWEVLLESSVERRGRDGELH